MAQLSNDSESFLAEYFDTHTARGVGSAKAVAADPGALWNAYRAIRRLPCLVAEVGSRTLDAKVVRDGLRRSNRIARILVGGTTAVLVVPVDRAAYLAGATESKRSLRTKVNRAERRGFSWQSPCDADERVDLLRLSDAYERAHPDQVYRNESPDNDYLAALSTWLVARDEHGTPLLLAVVAIEGEWAVLEYFKTLQNSDDAALARHWMSAVLVGRLAELGVHYLADILSPVGLPTGLRSYQRRLGYRLFRVRITGDAEERHSIAPRRPQFTSRS